MMQTDTYKRLIGDCKHIRQCEMNENYVPVVDVQCLEGLPLEIGGIVGIFAQRAVSEVENIESVLVILRLTNQSKLIERVNGGCNPEKPIEGSFDADEIHHLVRMVVNMRAVWLEIRVGWY